MFMNHISHKIHISNFCFKFWEIWQFRPEFPQGDNGPEHKRGSHSANSLLFGEVSILHFPCLLGPLNIWVSSAVFTQYLFTILIEDLPRHVPAIPPFPLNVSHLADTSTHLWISRWEASEVTQGPSLRGDWKVVTWPWSGVKIKEGYVEGPEKHLKPAVVGREAWLGRGTGWDGEGHERFKGQSYKPLTRGLLPTYLSLCVASIWLFLKYTFYNKTEIQFYL